MLKRQSAALGAALLCGILSGCASSRLKSWPSRDPEKGAVLLELSSEAKLGDLGVDSVVLRWPEAGAPAAAWSKSQHYSILSDSSPKGIADELVLVALKPGTYPSLALRLSYSGEKPRAVELEPQPPASLAVEAGKVVVLGKLILTADAKSLRLDGWPQVRAEVVDAALRRGESRVLRWKAPLEAARRDLATPR